MNKHYLSLAYIAKTVVKVKLLNILEFRFTALWCHFIQPITAYYSQTTRSDVTAFWCHIIQLVAPILAWANQLGMYEVQNKIKKYSHNDKTVTTKQHHQNLFNAYFKMRSVSFDVVFIVILCWWHYLYKT